MAIRLGRAAGATRGGISACLLNPANQAFFLKIKGSFITAVRGAVFSVSLFDGIQEREQDGRQTPSSPTLSIRPGHCTFEHSSTPEREMIIQSRAYPQNWGAVAIMSQVSRQALRSMIMPVNPFGFGNRFLANGATDENTSTFDRICNCLPRV